MPQICKARIVNFHYNNGHRLIPDLCFSFEGEDRKAMDTLISLTNGGGKSVIVQMLLQPILPRVKLDQRRLESYFTRPTDHSFILLEWSLDDSTDRLLTGIALSGRGGESEEQRGRRVQYYTFLAKYGQRGDPEDIVNLPLSTRKKREFQPAPYDYVKAQARKQSSRLRWFREERQADYRRELNSYGISTDEWRNVISAINQREGGLSNFFEQFKSSSRLIDELLLPCVEKKLKAGAPEGEDSSLETMLANYAREYAAVEEQLRERDHAAELEQELNVCSEELQPVHAQCERCEAVQGQMRGFALQLRKLRGEQLAKQEQAKAVLTDCEEKQRRIDQERSADQYYQAADKSAAALTVLEETRALWEQSGAEVERIQHRITVLECAKLAERLTRLDGERNALQEQLGALEGDSDSKERLERLRFTVWTLSAQALERTNQELSKLTREREKLRSQADALTADEKSQKQELETAKAHFNRLEGAIKLQQDELLKLVERLKSGIQLRLDGTVSLEVIREEAEGEQKQLAQYETNRETLVETITHTEDEIESLRERIAEAGIGLRELRRERQRAEEEWDAFRAQEEDLCALLRRYGVDESRRYTDQPRAELRGQLEEVRLTAHQRSQKRELLHRQMEAVRRGSLHIPDVVVEFLENSRVSFITCENYLKSWKQEDREKLLKSFPLCAYGIILDREDLQKLTTDLRPDWLPAAVPVFTYADLDAMLSGQEATGPAALACYSEEYFRDSEGFYDALERKARLLEQEAEQLWDRAAQMETDLRTVEAFSYPPSHGEQLREKCESLEESIDEQAANLAALEEKRGKAELSRDEQKTALRRLEQDLRAQERRVEDYARLTQQAEYYTGSLDTLAEAEAKVRSLTHSLKQTRQALEQRKAELDEQLTRLRDCEERSGEYQRLCAKTEGAKAVSLAEGELEALYAELECLEQEQDSNVKRVKRDLERISAQMEENRKDLARKKLDPSEYNGTRYSDAERDEAEEQLSGAQKLHRERTERYQLAKDDSTRKKAVEELRRKAVQEPLLPRAELQYDYERREQRLADARDRANRTLSQARRVEAQIDRIWERCEEFDRRFAQAEAAELSLEPDFSAQWKRLCRSWEDEENKRNELEQSFRKRLSHNQDRFREDDHYRRFFCSALELLERQEQGKRSDVVYSLYEQLGCMTESAQRRIVQLNTELGLLTSKRRELEKQICTEGEQLYNGLKTLVKSSRVKVEGRKTAIPMVLINLPEEVDSQVARSRITQELSQGLEALLEQMKKEPLSQKQLMEAVRPLCRSRTLLNSYTGQGELEVKVYKVDFNSRNSQYRTWKDTMIGNSGAEKFVSCFAVLVTMMNYTRDLGMGKKSSVLILDNPFGAITSAHLLEPMFRIAADFRVQMICLSDISKCDVTECFDSVIKATIRRNAFSNLELLEADTAELVERAFFRSEQVSLF